MKLEVLVATVGQTDLSLHKKMNIERDTIIANQCGKWEEIEEEFSYGKVKMVSSATKGVGINRNIALDLAKGDILLFADDDVKYFNPKVETVLKAFEEFKDADVILFGLDLMRNGNLYKSCKCKTARVHFWNALNYGTCRMAVKREAIIKKRIRFTTLFGGGAMYGSGEDSLFLLDCIRSGLKVYSYDYTLGTADTDVSTWFNGYNEKYLFDKGAWLACAFPRTKHLLKYYFLKKYVQKSGFSYGKTLALVNEGISKFPQLQGYKEK